MQTKRSKIFMLQHLIVRSLRTVIRIACSKTRLMSTCIKARL